MNVIRGADQCPSVEAPLLTIGTFDGVHRGHQAVLRQLKSWAKKTGSSSGVITFGQHPRKVLAGKGPDLLTSLEHRLVLFERAGMDFCWVLEFTKELSEMTAERFAQRFLIEGLKVKGLMLGFDSRFGCDQMGSDSEGLEPLAGRLGFEVRCLKPVQTEGDKPISSTLIREAIWAGRLRDAESMLGRHVSVLGKVVQGEARGRRLGYRTANLDLGREVRPPFGVYATIAHLDGKSFPSVTNVGYRPTVAEGLPGGEKPDLLIETHILDFKDEIYDRVLEVSFIEKLRDERRFPSVDALVEQIRKDEMKARGILEAHGM